MMVCILKFSGEEDEDEAANKAVTHRCNRHEPVGPTPILPTLRT